MIKKWIVPLFWVFWILASGLTAKSQITGNVYDDENVPLFGAYVTIPVEPGNGVITGEDGSFTITPKAYPVKVRIEYTGYQPKTLTLNAPIKNLNITLEPDAEQLSAAEVKAIRISEKERESPLTVESLGIESIAEAPAASFYESLGNLKGVDVTAASLGFRVVNTRGFNSTSPVRSLQLIDGVDNQSPGLNFSLGNFLGANDLDIKNVSIIAGASSAFYGPNAFNGVINMETKDPYQFPGLQAELKMGERQLGQFSMRLADYTTNDVGEKKFGYKVGFLYMQANDWEAENYNAITDSRVGMDNFGGYDAVNVYGDEVQTSGNDYSSAFDQFFSPGLGYIHRTGYREIDLVDYHTDNMKLNGSVFYRFTDSVQVSYGFNFSGGSTVYQGDNRYRLENIRFWQNRIELKKKDTYFLRFYSTNEDAGDSYDIVSTAFLLNDASSPEGEWYKDYARNWRLYGFQRQVTQLPGYPSYNSQEHGTLQEWADNVHVPFLLANSDSLMSWHARNRQLLDASASSTGLFPPRFEPGTPEFDDKFNSITSRLFTDTGTRFYDRSALYHVQGEHIFTPEFGKITVGGNGRLYRPESRGTILEDTGDVVIRNHEFGFYGGIEKRFFLDRLIVNATVRVDKNQNFDYLMSPAASLVYKHMKEHIIRASFSSAIRNPTLADQYLFYDVGRATLLGNLNGFDSLITIESFNDYRATTLNLDLLEHINVAPIRPEKARTVELGYKGTLADQSLFIDASYYFTFYEDFIGFNIGLDAQFDPNTQFPVGGIEVYRVAANAQSTVTTQGVSIGANYFFDKLSLGGNYSWNVLNKTGADDPIVPAFNTPEHKFNISLTGRKLKLPFTDKEQFGFGINYKWIQGFIFEGSPQFTGFIPTYDMVDAQMNYEVEKWNTVFKIGASNILGFMPLIEETPLNTRRTVFNNANYQVYGGPFVGRLAYFSVQYNLDRRLKKEE
jgi:iron complex outermembrane receptor protein